MFGVFDRSLAWTGFIIISLLLGPEVLWDSGCVSYQLLALVPLNCLTLEPVRVGMLPSNIAAQAGRQVNTEAKIFQ